MKSTRFEIALMMFAVLIVFVGIALQDVITVVLGCTEAILVGMYQVLRAAQFYSVIYIRDNS